MRRLARRRGGQRRGERVALDGGHHEVGERGAPGRHPEPEGHAHRAPALEGPRDLEHPIAGRLDGRVGGFREALAVMGPRGEARPGDHEVARGPRRGAPASSRAGARAARPKSRRRPPGKTSSSIHRPRRRLSSSAASRAMPTRSGKPQSGRVDWISRTRPASSASERVATASISSGPSARPGAPAAGIGIRAERAGVTQHLEGQQRGEPVLIALGKAGSAGIQRSQRLDDTIHRVRDEPRRHASAPRAREGGRARAPPALRGRPGGRRRAGRRRRSSPRLRPPSATPRAGRAGEPATPPAGAGRPPAPRGSADPGPDRSSDA